MYHPDNTNMKDKNSSVDPKWVHRIHFQSETIESKAHFRTQNTSNLLLSKVNLVRADFQFSPQEQTRQAIVSIIQHLSQFIGLAYYTKSLPSR